MKFNGYFENGIRCITIETPGKYKDQETTLKVRISEIPDSVEMKIEYLHTEDSNDVLQETFYSQRKFWDRVSQEIEKLERQKKFYFTDVDNHVHWRVKP